MGLRGGLLASAAEVYGECTYHHHMSIGRFPSAGRDAHTAARKARPWRGRRCRQSLSARLRRSRLLQTHVRRGNVTYVLLYWTIWRLDLGLPLSGLMDKHHAIGQLAGGDQLTGGWASGKHHTIDKVSRLLSPSQLSVCHEKLTYRPVSSISPRD